jgi:hypothetical protein
MTTAFDTELTETLRELADEVAPTSRSLAATALADGRRIHARHTMLAAVASVVALIVLAVPVVTAAVIHERSTNSAALPGATTSANLRLTAFPGAGAISAKELANTQKVLRARFASAGIHVVGFKATGRDQLQITLKGQVSTARITPLLVPGLLEIRAVLGIVADQGPASSGILPIAQSDLPSLAQVEAKLGSAYTVAAALTGPAPAGTAALAPFARLTPLEVSVLPAMMQFDVPTISCAQLAARPVGATAGTALRSDIVTCGLDQGRDLAKYLLADATITSADVSGTERAFYTDAVGNPVWQVEMSFHLAGQQRWADLAKQLYDEYVADSNYRQIAILMDTTVLTAPNIEAEIPGPAIIDDPDLTKKSATSLTTQIKDGSLPVALSIS